MSKYDTEVDGVEAVETDEEFNLNDPAVAEWNPAADENLEGEPEHVVPEPPEGNIMIRVKLREQRDGGKPTLNIFGPKKGHPPGVSAMLGVQELRWASEVDEWVGGQFLKDCWCSTVCYMDSEKMAKLNIVMKRAGRPFPAAKPGASGREILEARRDHVREVFEEFEENGIEMPAYVRWIKSVAKLDDDGDQVVDEEGKKQYIEIKGRKKIIAAAERAAKKEGVEMGLTGAELKAHIEKAKRTAHMYEDSDGEERTVRAEVDRFLSLEEWDKHLAAEERKREKAEAAAAKAAQ